MTITATRTPSNNIKWIRSAYFGGRERRRLICRIFIWNWSLALHISFSSWIDLFICQFRRENTNSFFTRRCHLGCRRHRISSLLINYDLCDRCDRHRKSVAILRTVTFRVITTKWKKKKKTEMIWITPGFFFSFGCYVNELIQTKLI